MGISAAAPTAVLNTRPLAEPAAAVRGAAAIIVYRSIAIGSTEPPQ
jgi:hypothetical protein